MGLSVLRSDVLDYINHNAIIGGEYKGSSLLMRDCVGGRGFTQAMKSTFFCFLQLFKIFPVHTDPPNGQKNDVVHALASSGQSSVVKSIPHNKIVRRHISIKPQTSADQKKNTDCGTNVSVGRRG